MKLTTGMQVRLARIGKGWTLKNLADKTSYSIFYLSKIENNRRPVPDVVKNLLLDNGPNWYLDIIKAITACNSGKYANQLIESFHNAIKLK